MRRKHVLIRGEKVPVKMRALKKSGVVGLAYKPTKGDRRPVRRRIAIEKTMRRHARMRTLVHEMIHQLDMGLSERTVLRLENGIVQMVAENPEVFHELSDI